MKGKYGNVQNPKTEAPIFDSWYQICDNHFITNWFHKHHTFLTAEKVFNMSILSSFVKTELNGSKNQIHDSSADITKEFKNFLCDVEDLFKSSSALTGDDLAKTKQELSQRIKTARATIGDASGNIVQQAIKKAALTNQYVHQQPWTIIGTGVALSFLVGYLLARRD